MPLPIGGASFLADKGHKIIRFALHGHANRPFFHIVLTTVKIKEDGLPVEQLGTYDPMPNEDNQKLLNLNIERTRYWMGQGVVFSKAVAKLLGKVGFLDIHPETYREAWRMRFKEAKAEAKKAQESPSDAHPSSSAS